MGLLLALGASLSWGVSDYLGGVKSRVVPLLTLIAVSQVTGLVLLGGLALAFHAYPTGKTTLYAALAGSAGVIALAAFYRGMAIGRISIVAPISATGVVIPVAVGLARGERPGAVALAGIAFALAGVVLASAENHPERGRSLAAEVPMALAARARLRCLFPLPRQGERAPSGTRRHIRAAPGDRSDRAARAAGHAASRCESRAPTCTG